MRIKKLHRSVAMAALFVGFGLPGSTPVSFSAKAQESGDFYSFVRELGEKARVDGVSQRTVDAVIPTLSFNQTVINLDRAQPGGKPGDPIPKFAPYRAKHVDSARINRGRAKYSELRGLLQRVEQQSGVP
jgi:membrane-bound lytic murein transglycosylase B